MSVCLIDYGCGNLVSVRNALQQIGVDVCVSASSETIRAAERVILPGVGHAAHALEGLERRSLTDLLPQLTQPVLGICLGLQLLCRSSEEGQVNGIGVFDADVRRFAQNQIVPHLGWNSVTPVDGRGLLPNTPTYLYFSHSYYAPVISFTVAVTTYGERFSAILQRDNFIGVQFHPEKSGEAGLQLLRRFLEQ